MKAFVVASLLLCLSIGCAHRENIPTYPDMSVADSLEVIRERSSKVRDISGEGVVTLTDAKRRSIRLDAAFVFAPPDRARIRAWKFGQAVLDLTITPDGAWLFMPRSDERTEQMRGNSREVTRAMQQWLSLLATRFDSTDVRESGSELIVQVSPDVVAYIDRRTLTPRRYVARRFELNLDSYRTISEDVVWPGRIEGKSPGGLVRIDLRDIELNVAPPSAFKPPARAERLP